MLIHNVLIFDSKKISKKDLEFQNKVLPLQPVSEKSRKCLEVMKKFLPLQPASETEPFIDIMKTSSKPTRFRTKSVRFL